MSNIIIDHSITNTTNVRLKIFVDSEQVTTIDPGLTYSCSLMEHEKITVQLENESCKGDSYSVIVLEEK